MRSGIFVLICAICGFMVSCKAGRKPFIIQKDYSYYNKDTSQILETDFVARKDTAYVWYTFVLNDGDLIDGGDSTDFAGCFLKRNLIDNSIKLRIKDYIKDPPLVGGNFEPPLFYDLKITFLSDSTFKWHIDTTINGIPPRLPYDVTFKRDKDEAETNKRKTTINILKDLLK